jgi:hypothetical protein
MTTASAYPLLEALRDTLATVPGVATCRIGLEANMTPADYPMVRIVPSRGEPAADLGGSMRQVQCLIYFGQAQHEFAEGLQAQYEALLAMEAALIDAAQGLRTAAAIHRETIFDEDRVDAYKLLALRVDLMG